MPPRRSPDTITDPARAPATPTVKPLSEIEKRRELRDHTSMKPLEFVAWIMADCEKGGVWFEKSNKCGAKKQH